MIRLIIALTILIGLSAVSVPASPQASGESWPAGQQLAACDWRVTG